MHERAKRRELAVQKLTRVAHLAVRPPPLLPRGAELPVRAPAIGRPEVHERMAAPLAGAH